MFASWQGHGYRLKKMSSLPSVNTFVYNTDSLLPSDLGQYLVWFLFTTSPSAAYLSASIQPNWGGQTKRTPWTAASIEMTARKLSARD
jgi:hypothetical protein